MSISIRRTSAWWMIVTLPGRRRRRGPARARARRRAPSGRRARRPRALDAGREARRVHHQEHVFEAAVRLAHQVPGGALAVAESHHAGRAPWIPSLCSMETQCTSLRCVEAAVGFHQPLGHDEQRRAPGARRSIRRPREHEVHDVLGQVVLAVGNEDLLAEDAGSAVGLRLGAGAHRREVGPGLRLGQVHGAGPLSAHHLRQVLGLLRLGPGHGQRVDRPSLSGRTSEKARFAEAHISRTAAPTARGSPCPPNSGSHSSAFQPASRSCR